MEVRGSLIAVPRNARVVAFDPASSRIWVVLSDRCTVSVVSASSGEEIARRTYEGCDDPSCHGAYLVFRREGGGFAVGPADLSAAAEPLLEGGSRLLGIAAGVAHVCVEEEEDRGDSTHFRFDRVAVDLATRKVLGKTVDGAQTWRFPHPDRDLALRVDGARIDAFRSTTGEALWSVEPFRATPIDSIDGLALHGERLHVRASRVDEDGHGSIVVMLDPSSGAACGTPRRSSAAIPAWIGDHGDAVEAVARELDGFQSELPDGIALEQDDQLVLVRRTDAGAHVQRVGAPHMRESRLEAGHLCGIASIEGGDEVVLLRLPDRGEGEVVSTRLEPRGPLAPTDGEPATIAFVASSAPMAVAVHAKHGRINLGCGDEHAGVKKGDPVTLTGLVVKPGGVVSVESWHLAGQPRVRRAIVLEPPPPRERPKPAYERPASLVVPLRARAADAGLALPAALVALVEQVEASRALRSALHGIGLHFEPDQLALDTLDDLAAIHDDDALSGFCPVWGNGYEDAIGGLLRGREGLVVVHLPERDVVDAGHDIVAVIRRKLDDPDVGDATRARIESALATLAS